jgi:hypothetical protein
MSPQHTDLISLGHILSGGMAGSYGSSSSNFFWGNSMLFFIMAILIYIWPTVYENSTYSTFTLFAVFLWQLFQLRWDDATLIWFTLSWWLAILDFFQVFVGLLYIFFWELSQEVICPFKDWIICALWLSCLSSLCILDINFLSDERSTNIFTHSIDWLFALLIVSFAVQKLFSLI